MRFAKTQLSMSLVIYAVLVNVFALFGRESTLIINFFEALYFLFIPGAVLIKVLKVQTTKLDFLLYSLGLSLTHILIVGMTCNWIAPLFGVTRPLSIGPLLSVFNISFFIIVTLLHLTGIESISLNISLRLLKNKNHYLKFGPLLTIPFLGYFGAVLLNNRGSGLLIILMYVVIIFYLLLTVFVKPAKGAYPYILYLISLGILFAGSIRSYQIAGPDPAMEYGLSNYLLKLGKWNYWDVDNNYYGMLSIVLLQPILSLFFKISLFTVIKVIFPAIFSLVPVVLFSLFNKITDHEKAFYGALFFIIQPNFVVWNLFPPRQEIAFIFMSLMYLVIFDKTMTPKIRTVFFLIFGFSLVVSHYSTTYVTSVVIITGYMLSRIYNWWTIRGKTNHINLGEKKPMPLTGIMVLLFLMIEFFWYFQFTNIGVKAVNIIDNKLFSNAFSRENSPLSIFSKKTLIPNKDYLEQYVDAISNIKITSYSDGVIEKYPTEYESTSEIDRADLYPIIYPIFEKAKLLLLAIGGLSVIVGFLISVKNKNGTHVFYLILSGVSLMILAMFVPLPFVSSYYDPIRLFLQFLILLSIFPVLAFYLIDKLQPNLGKKLFIIFSILYFIFLSHSVFYFLGGGRAQLILINAGKDYDLHYTISNEIKSMDWMLKNNKNKNTMVFDNYGQFKLYQSEHYSLNSNIKLDVLPQSINKNDYVYGSRANIVQGITFKYGAGGLLIYNFPKLFLEDNKNQVYTNGSSIIYK